jgi:hypothetical protein
MPVGFVLVFIGVRREYRESVGEPGSSPGQPRQKKVRIWDEEDA